MPISSELSFYPMLLELWNLMVQMHDGFLICFLSETESCVWSSIMVDDKSQVLQQLQQKKAETVAVLSRVATS